MISSEVSSVLFHAVMCPAVLSLSFVFPVRCPTQWGAPVLRQATHQRLSQGGT